MATVTKTVKMKEMTIIKDGIKATINLDNVGGAKKYSATDTYSVNDLISLNGNFYRAKQSVTGINPEDDTNEIYWFKLVPVHTFTKLPDDNNLQSNYLYGTGNTVGVHTPIVNVKDLPVDSDINPSILYGVKNNPPFKRYINVVSSYPSDSQLLEDVFYGIIVK